MLFLKKAMQRQIKLFEVLENGKKEIVKRSRLRPILLSLKCDTGVTVEKKLRKSKTSNETSIFRKSCQLVKNNPIERKFFSRDVEVPII